MFKYFENCRDKKLNNDETTNKARWDNNVCQLILIDPRTVRVTSPANTKKNV